MNKIPLTVEGESKLRVELDELKRVARPRIVQAIAEARAHGDLKENAEYHAARDEQGFSEARIRDLEGKLSNAHVIDVSQIPPGDKVIFGSTVTIINVDSDETVSYKIVGDDEADVTLIAPEAVFRAILDGSQNAAMAFMSGKLKVDGSNMRAIKVSEILTA